MRTTARNVKVDDEIHFPEHNAWFKVVKVHEPRVQGLVEIDLVKATYG